MSFRLFCCLGLLSLSPLTAAPPPNVILILADDLGYGDLACYGHPLFQTPHLDQMAREGVRFTQFNCPSAFCAPTRSTLLTGRTPSRNGMRGNPAPDATPAADAMVLPASERLLPQVLGAAGYRADMLGKWHLGHQPGFLPTERGFESYFGIPYSNDMRPVRLLEGTQVAEEPAVQSTLTERYTQRACDLIRRHQDEPFFLYLAHAMPHKPLAVSPAFDGRTGHGLYADVIAELDASIGTLRQTLADTGLTERTLILFTSDNGPWFGGSTGGLRGMKGATYEGGFRVPCIVCWPSVIPPGRTLNDLATTADLFPTILEACSVPLPEDRIYDGYSLLPLLKAETEDAPHLTVPSHRGDTPIGIRDERWKLHVTAPIDRFGQLDPSKPWDDPRAPDGKTILAPPNQYQPKDYPGLRTGAPAHDTQLFDLANDPSEQTDVTDAHPDVVARLMAAFRAYTSSLAPAPAP